MKKLILTIFSILFITFTINAQKISPKLSDEIKFSTNSDKLFSSSQVVLDKLIIKMKNDTSIYIQITGYADNIDGRAAYNSKLAQKRANAVKKYITDKGIIEKRLSIEKLDYSSPETLKKLKKLNTNRKIDIREVIDN